MWENWKNIYWEYFFDSFYQARENDLRIFLFSVLGNTCDLSSKSCTGRTYLKGKEECMVRHRILFGIKMVMAKYSKQVELNPQVDKKVMKNSQKGCFQQKQFFMV